MEVYITNKFTIFTLLLTLLGGTIRPARYIRGVIESSPNYHKKQADTFKVLIATVPFKVVPLVAYTTIPTFLPRSESVLEFVWCQHLQHLLRFGLDFLYGVKSSPLQLDFHLGKTKKSQGAKSGK